ncbi:MAG: hypothetical protein COV74_04200 [Candidatus Omnitrophica bacterium CG11_big_fil_rev_8_21_14_0_20_45_26]|uniref:Type IV pilus modification protein PilV n=1 Tax=Candidatus Abzuiibacterium crystallinum TaxID=1974748 RepID=A0A2H0LQF8_9BACT|nr:MAG: hypothetical protein COV74_04200 [Candidatus Omnitrophica bacterium CG11_big_fil_rev_8_21_14_0_20_45_26]PIW63986.1 MAG: hypothetical protein COW12_08780 [Candidatus Omnitrophica bacterium CG12_big_fil_rev_8_21_14_0_65_45_16]
MTLTKNSKNGFTLIEAMLAVGLISLTMFTLIASFHYALAMNAVSRNRIVAMNDVRRVAEQLRIAADNGLSGVASVQWNNYISHSLPNEAVQVSTAGSDPLTATIVLSWNEKGRTESMQIDTKVTAR